MKAVGVTGIVGPWVLLFSGFLAGGCGPEQRYKQVLTCAEHILRGEGAERALLSNRDYYSLYLDSLRDTDERIRMMGYLDLSPCRVIVIPNCKYLFMADAYIDADRTEEMLTALQEAAMRAEKEGDDRHHILMTYAAVKVLAQIWASPQIAKSVRVHPLEPPLVGYSGLSLGQHGIESLVEKLIAEGDEDLRRVWEEID